MTGFALTGTTRGRLAPASPRALRGMTLIEILVVLVLIGVVLGIVGGNFIGKGEKAKADAAKIEISQIAQTLDLYKLEIGHYPTTQEGLQALISAPAGVTNWNGPYWKRSTVPKDPWGNEYKYVSPSQTAPYEIVSLGARMSLTNVSSARWNSFSRFGPTTKPVPRT